MDESKTTSPNLHEMDGQSPLSVTLVGGERCVDSESSTEAHARNDSLSPRKPNHISLQAGDIMFGVTPECSGGPITFSVLERAYEKLKTREPNTELFEQRMEEFRIYAKARYARFLGVETLTPEQEKELWDGISHAYARHIGLIDAEGNLN